MAFTEVFNMETEFFFCKADFTVIPTHTPLEIRCLVSKHQFHLPLLRIHQKVEVPKITQKF